MIKGTAAGNLGGDAQLKHLQDGTPVLEFSIGTRGEKDRSTGEAQTTWVRCTMWGKRGETIAQYLNKGRYVVAFGGLSMRSYTTGAGEARTSLEMRVDDVSFGPPVEGSAQPQQQQQRQASPPQQQQQRQAPPQQMQQPQQQRRQANF